MKLGQVWPRPILKKITKFGRVLGRFVGDTQGDEVPRPQETTLGAGIISIYLTEHGRRVTIVTNIEKNFFTQKIHEFHTKIVQFRYFFTLKIS